MNGGGFLNSWRIFASIGRLHIVAIAALGTFTFGWLFYAHYWPALALLCALDWFLVNLLNRVVDLDEDALNRITGTAFVARNKRSILVFGFSLLAFSFVVTLIVAPWLTPFRVAYHALGFAYNWPLLPGGKRIKQLYFWKNTASATGFMLTVFGYPWADAHTHSILFANGVSPLTVLVAGLFFFPFELSYEVLYDLRDVDGDRASHVASYPVVHGEKNAIRIIDGLLAGSIAAIVIGYVAHAIPWRLFIMSAAPLLQIVLYKQMVKRGITATDCIRLTWIGAALLVTYHVWFVLGLPGAGIP